jgi:hypothetical protein
VHGRRGEVAVTVRVTTLKGAAAGAYYVEALPNYYLDADEPRGVWHGLGAGMLGLTGTVEDGAFLALMAGMLTSRFGAVAGERVHGEVGARVRCDGVVAEVGVGVVGGR